MVRVLLGLIGVLGICALTSAQTVNLVATPYPTFVDPSGTASRYTAVVEEAFRRMGRPLNIQVLRQAFVGSALRSERADGELAFIALDEQRDPLLYSNAYTDAELYLASRTDKVNSVASFSYIANERVATENRFANTAQLRPIDSIRWSRNPTTFDMFRQIGDERANYLFADKLMIDEFNRMLSDAKRPPLFLSPTPLVTTTVHISIRKSLPDGVQLLAAFNTAIEQMKEDGTLAQLILHNTDSNRPSLLDEGRYRRMMRNW